MDNAGLASEAAREVEEPRLPVRFAAGYNSVVLSRQVTF